MSSDGCAGDGEEGDGRVNSRSEDEREEGWAD